MGRNEYDTGKRRKGPLPQTGKNINKVPENANAEFACSLDALVKSKDKNKQKQKKQGENGGD